MSARRTTATVAAEPQEPGTFTHRQILVIFSGLMLGMLLASLDGTIVATALPTITGDLGGLNHLSWVVTSYLLASAVVTPIYGKLGDLYGRKRLFQAAIVIFLVGSALCGLAQDMNQLIAFRALQGIGGGGLIVLAQASIADVVSPRERGRYQGYFGALFGLSSIAGPMLGGFFTDHLSWRWVFYINLPLGILALFVTSAVLPAGRRRAGVSIDYLGAAVLTAAITCIVLFTTWGGTQYDWGSAPIIGLIVASVVLVGLVVVVERRATEPLLPLHLFRERTFRIASADGFIVGVAMYGSVSFLPLFLQVVTGASATNSGLLLLPLMLGMLGASVLAGQVITRTGHYKPFPVTGMALGSVAMFLLSTMGPSTTQATVSVYMAMLGIGLGFTMQVLVLATQNSVPAKDLGAATSSVSFARSMGGTIGVAVFGAVFNMGLSDRLAGLSIAVGEGSSFSAEVLEGLAPQLRSTAVGAFAESLTTVFLVATPLIVVAFLLALRLPVRPLRAAPGNALRDEEDTEVDDPAPVAPTVAVRGRAGATAPVAVAAAAVDDRRLPRG
jgi:EmrB/QacA subfamily drug resistance transporter